MLKFRQADTLVEVMVGFAVFTVVAVGTSAIMNRGVSMVERSLEVTLVREQIDSQAALLRYARSSDPSVWAQIRAAAAATTSVPDVVMDSCPSQAPADSFALSVNQTTNALTFYDLTSTPSPYEPAYVNSEFDTVAPTPKFYGMWVIPVVASVGSSTATTNAYDMHIGTCWYAPGSDLPVTLGTIVRIYDTK